MFCSASDRGGNNTESCYPGDWQLCLRIGGATFAGDKLPWVEQDVDFWFPGRDVPFRAGDDNESVVYESGSSIATAAASGLAGVLLYCERLLASIGVTDESLSDKNAIAAAFKNVDGKFPRTDSIFNMFLGKLHLENPYGPIKPDIASLKWNKKSKSALTSLMNYIKVSGPVGASFKWPSNGADREHCRRIGHIVYGISWSGDDTCVQPK